MSHSYLVFVEKRLYLHTSCSKQTSKLSQLQNKKFELTYKYFPCHLLTAWEVNLRTWINRRWEWIILNVRSLTVFEENIVVTALAKLIPLLFKSVYVLFNLTCSLIDRCQIVTKTCENDVSNFVWKPFKSPLSIRKWKCFGEASLFNLHYLLYNYHLISQKLFNLGKILS